MIYIADYVKAAVTQTGKEKKEIINSDVSQRFQNQSLHQVQWEGWSEVPQVGFRLWVQDMDGWMGC